MPRRRAPRAVGGWLLLEAETRERKRPELLLPAIDERRRGGGVRETPKPAHFFRMRSPASARTNSAREEPRDDDGTQV